MNNSENGKEDEALKKAALEADASSKDITENKETPKVYNFQKRKKPITPADPAPKEEKEAPKEEDTLSNPLGGVKSEKPVQEEAKKEEPKETKPQTESPVQEEKPLPVTKEESPTPKEVEEPLPKCPACGEELPKKGLKFCPFCGKNLVEPVLKKEEPKAKAKLHCNDCGKDIYQGNMRFCPYCGSSDLTRLEEKPEAVVKPVSSPTPAPSPAVIPTPLASAPKPPSEARHCPKCGRPLPLDFVGEYCPYCGGALSKEVEQKEKRCPSCGKILPPDAQGFCPYCGGILPKDKPHLERKCPHCEHVLAEDVDGFCPYCGTSLTGGKAAYERVEEKKKCPKCGKELPEDADAYCPFCGQELSLAGKACPSCGKILPADADKNCPYCGVDLHPSSSPAPVTPFEVPEIPYPKLAFKLKKLRPAILIFLILILACGGYGVFLASHFSQYSSVPFFTPLTFITYFLFGDILLSLLGIILVAFPLKQERQLLGWVCFLNCISFCLSLVSLGWIAYLCVRQPDDAKTMLSLILSPAGTLDYSALYAQVLVFICSLVVWILVGNAKSDAKRLENGVKGYKWSYFAYERPGLINLYLTMIVILLGIFGFLLASPSTFFVEGTSGSTITSYLQAFAIPAGLLVLLTILHFPSPKKAKPLAIVGLVFTILLLFGMLYTVYAYMIVNEIAVSSNAKMTAYLIRGGLYMLPLVPFWIAALVKSIKAVRSGFLPAKK